MVDYHIMWNQCSSFFFHFPFKKKEKKAAAHWKELAARLPGCNPHTWLLEPLPLPIQTLPSPVPAQLARLHSSFSQTPLQGYFHNFSATLVSVSSPTIAIFLGRREYFVAIYRVYSPYIYIYIYIYIKGGIGPVHCLCHSCASTVGQVAGRSTILCIRPSQHFLFPSGHARLGLGFMTMPG
jgi:hypothetical protein